MLANIRRQLTEKLSKLPLGSMLSQSSGTYQNIICERVDSIETTLAHIILMVAHRLKTVEHADQIIVIDSGKIVQQVKHHELMQQDGIYRTFVTDKQKAVIWKL